MDHHILMGDVVASSKQDHRQLQADLKELVASCNTSLAPGIKSPYTITLGDEFQGVAASLRDSVAAILFLEEKILSAKLDFKLHYVAHLGPIDTPINPDIAHQMMGTGLTTARALLTQKRRERPRFHFEYPDPLVGNLLNDIFFVLERIIDRWNLRDYALITDMIAHTDNAEVGQMHGKDRSLIWRRRATLRIEEYRRLKSAVEHIAADFDTVRNSAGS